MTNEERLAKLEQAKDLIRDVEFSYEVGHHIRKVLYSTVVNTFSWGSQISYVTKQIKDEIEEAERAKLQKDLDED